MKNEIILALLEGKTVQYNHFDSDYNWHDFNPKIINSDPNMLASLFIDEMSYIWRLKPGNITLNVRLALMRPVKDYVVIAVYTPEEESIKSKSLYFVKWLTDWVAYEIEESTQIG